MSCKNKPGSGLFTAYVAGNTMLNAIREGQGETVLLLHSSGMSSRQWRRLIDRLSPHYRVIAPDALGAGASPPWPADAPFHHREDASAILELIDTSPVHIVGHSYGGLLALMLAKQDPTRVRSLALYEPVAFGVLWDPPDEIGLKDVARLEEDPRFREPPPGGEEVWLESFVEYWNGPGAWRMLPPPTREAFLLGGRKVILEVTSLMQDRTPIQAYASLPCPTLLLTGENSPAAAGRVCALLSAALPRGELRRINGAGHMGPITHASEVNEAIAAHLAAHAI